MAQPKGNILGTMPVSRLVISMSCPIMLSMLMQAIYNLVDSVYVAQYNDTAFLALSYAYPIQMLMIAFCVGIGVGLNATLARKLGEKNEKEAVSTVLHGLLLYLLCWLLWLFFALFLCPFYFRSVTDTQTVVTQGISYLRVCCAFSIGICLQFPCERILQSTGHPAGFMIVQGSGAILNIILDPIFIFIFDMGVTGAAVATVTGQISGALIGIFLVSRIRRQLPITLRGFRFDSTLTRDMCRIAGPAIVMQSLASLMSLGLNSILHLWSETAVWVLGVYFKLQSFVFMPIFGINNGLVPIISFNYGAKSRERVSRSIRFGLQFALLTALTGTALLWFLAAPLLTVCFNAGPEALALGVPSLHMSALAFPVAAVSIVFSSAFQSLGHSRYSLWVALLRQLILLLPAALLLVLTAPQFTFLAFLAAEILTCTVTLFLFRKVKAEKIDQISSDPPEPALFTEKK